MRKTMKLLALLLTALTLLTACSAGKTPAAGREETAAAAGREETAAAAFTPRLDTEKAVELNAAVFFGNFEALDQVINHFNEYYPNVTIIYEAVNDSSDPDFLTDNAYLDIFMTSTDRGYAKERCVDLLAEGVDVSAVGEGLLNSNTSDGKLLALPMGLTLRGIVVNETLLKNEGLEVPQTWQEFLDVCEALKQKGYTPIQGPNSAVANLCYNMGMAMMSSDEKLLASAESGDAENAAALQTVFDRLSELVEKGYISPEVNAEYPENNYEDAILRFFGGKVPFWVCDTEKVSGMKKRESKSEAFSAHPFEYAFTFAPMGDSGVYEYIEPWYGFAVNKDSDVRDYAVEFLRFMAREEELDTLASVKGVPSIGKAAPDERYVNLRSIEKVESAVISDGSIPASVGKSLNAAATWLLTGEAADPGDALAKFAAACAEGE